MARQGISRACGRFSARRLISNWRAIGTCGRFTNSIGSIRIRWTGRARGFYFFCIRTQTRRIRRRARTRSGGISGRCSPGNTITTATRACNSSLRWSQFCPPARAWSAITRRSGRCGVRKKTPKRAPPASRCCGISTATRPRRLAKNARSCSDFSSINRAWLVNVCDCSIFPLAKQRPRRVDNYCQLLQYYNHGSRFDRTL